MRGNRLIDLTGQRFGRLTVIKRTGSYEDDSGHTIPTWLCVCDCGNGVVVLGNCLRSGNTKSCGCLRKEVCPENRRRYSRKLKMERSMNYAK